MKLLSNLDRANDIITNRMNMLFNANNHVNSCEIFHSGSCDCGIWSTYIQDGLLLKDFNQIKKILKESEAHSDMLANERELLKEIFYRADENLRHPHTNEEWALDERIRRYKKYVEDNREYEGEG